MTGYYPDDFVPLNLDCERCGLGIHVAPDAEGRGLIDVDEEIVCPDCRATMVMGVDDDIDDDSDDGIGTAYVSSWTCRHGADEGADCWRCTFEDWRGDVWRAIRNFFQRGTT